MSKKILIITGDAGESYEAWYAIHRFAEAGIETQVAAPSKKRLNMVMHDFEEGWDTYVERKGYGLVSDLTFAEVNPDDYQAVLILGGRAPEYLRHDPKVLEIILHFHQADKFIFSICHGIQILIAAGIVAGRIMTCYEHVRFELESCGGAYVADHEAVRDGKIVTGQTWESHPDFYRAVFECLRELEVSSAR